MIRAIPHQHHLRGRWQNFCSPGFPGDANYFRSDLKEARERLHTSFSTIYGLMYQRNRDFFYRLFADLDDYMAGKRGQLKNLLDEFFSQLRTSIVGLMETTALGGGSGGGGGGTTGGNTGHPVGGGAAAAAGSATGLRTQDSKRIQCLSNGLNKQNPFDGVDTRLQSRFLEAYPPARMLVNSLAAGSALVKSILREVTESRSTPQSFFPVPRMYQACRSLSPPLALPPIHRTNQVDETSRTRQPAA
ncbi:unnamed protein product [Schistocephalus solidus]|uniref:Glypican-6 n=1 Tax=Schistocephalus solidus TaxID=70667 RepID=A0A183SLS3_SCHSO|nr:unnamed protein product [Schistocephalus solidus]